MTKPLLLILCLVVILGYLSNAAISEEFEHLGLAELDVVRLEIHNNCLYAGTLDGVRKFDLSDPNPVWEDLGLHGEYITALLLIGSDTILAGTFYGANSIYRSTDGGTSWEPFQNNFGNGVNFAVDDFEVLAGQTDTIFATSDAAVARSTDQGMNWEVVWGSWDGLMQGIAFIKADPNDRNILWAGGGTGIFTPIAIKSINAGDDWSNGGIHGIENRCNNVAIYPGNSGDVWIVMGGYIKRTDNFGKDWYTVDANIYSMYAIEINVFRPKNMYVSTAREDYPLTLLISRDTGNTWTPISEDAGEECQTWDMVSVSETDSTILYFGTSNGVYKYTDIIPPTCCIGMTGNVDCDEQQSIDGIDLATIIDHLFISLDSVCCFEEANVDFEGEITGGDLSVLIDHLFISLEELPNCP